MIYRGAVRPVLFSQDAETAHERTIDMLAALCEFKVPGRRRVVTHARLQTEVAGITFPNPVGLAAGCDKNARAVPIWPQFGFGFVEVGTVTAQPQPGNPRPRVFRYPPHEALVNRLGFNSEGSEAVAKRLALLRRNKRPLQVPLGINIGKTKLVTEEEAVLEDYATSFRRLSRMADFMVINVSSPNTPGLRQWQEKGKLATLLNALMQQSRDLAQKRQESPVPLFVKISPDMADADMEDVVEVALAAGLAGIIATNTTIQRPGNTLTCESTGGLSGRPLRARATEVVRFLYRLTQGKLPIIGVGGIFSAEDAYERLQAGASLVQIYTGLVYEGPYLPARVNAGLLKLMERDGVSHLRDIVGSAVGSTGGVAY